MGEDQKYYDVEDYKRWKRGQGKAYKVAPRPNLLAAANWLRKFFDSRKTNWAALGSLAMLCLGSRREIPDIHIVYDDRDFQRIRMKLQTDSRVRLPKDMNSMFSAKLLISTGPKFKDAGCTEHADIEVEMIPPGSHGTPPSDILRSNQALLTLNLDGKATNIKGLNMLFLANTTVHLCNNQDLLWDPRKDLLWLCRMFGKEIGSIRGQLNARQVQENFLGTPLFSTFSAEDQRLCYHVLLGKDPPPSMFLTPAPPLGQVASAVARPPIPSHKSAPSLRDRMQQEAFLKPPMSYKTKSAPSTPPNGLSQNTTANSTKEEAITDATRKSHSRYHNRLSTPSKPGAGQEPNSEAITVRAGRANSGPEYPRQHSMIYQAYSVNMQSLAQNSKPHVVQTKKSLPQTNGQMSGSVPVFAQKPLSTSSAPPNNVLLAPATEIRQFNSKGSPGTATSKGHANNSSLPSAAVAQPHVAQTHPAYKIIAYRNSIMPALNNTTAAAPSITDSEDMKPQIHSKGLAIVGPEGLYPTPLKPSRKPTNSQAAASIKQGQTHTTSSSFAFELDATPKQAELSPKAILPAELIAELPAVNTLLPPPQPTDQQFNTLPESPISPPQEPVNVLYKPAYMDSPVSPATTYRAPSLVQPLSLEPRAQPSTAAPVSSTPKPVLTTPSFESLPPSLMVGIRAPHQHTLINAATRPRATSQSSNGSNASAALTKYQRYYSPPNSREPSPKNHATATKGSRQPSPRRDPVVAYKAYTPPITPPIQLATEPGSFQSPVTMSQGLVLTPPALVPALAPAPKEGFPIPMEQASTPAGRISPPDILRPGANISQSVKTRAFHLPNPLAVNPPMPRISSHVKHDSHQGSQNHPAVPGALMHATDTAISHQRFSQFYSSDNAQAATHKHAQQPQYVAFSSQHHPSSTHQRTISSESNTSTSSHDSEKLAHEYQLDLPSFEDGYSSKKPAAQIHKDYPSYDGSEYGRFSTDFKLHLPDFGKAETGRFMDGYEFMK